MGAKVTVIYERDGEEVARDEAKSLVGALMHEDGTVQSVVRGLMDPIDLVTLSVASSGHALQVLQDRGVSMDQIERLSEMVRAALEASDVTYEDRGEEYEGG